MTTQTETQDLDLLPEDNERLANLCGQLDRHLRQIESRLGIEINNRGNRFRLIGAPEAVRAGAEVVRSLYEATAEEVLTPERLHLLLQKSGIDALLREQTP